MEELEAKRQHLMKIMKQKDEIEQQILEVTEFLETPPMPGVKGPLVDSEGFPRADIDLVEVRKLRHRLACLQTDHCTVMKEIEAGLLGLHSDYKARNINIEGEKPALSSKPLTTQASQTSELLGQPSAQELKIPFAWISDVISGSPADQAGLKMGDAVFQFGEVNHTNHDELRAIVEPVKAQVNNPIKVRVLRKNLFGGSEERDVEFVPREWGGRGYLGCALKLNPV